MTRVRWVAVGSGLALLIPSAWLVLRPAPALPAGLPRAIVFVSDRNGTPALYCSDLARRRERRLTFGSEAVGEPAVSPDGARVAFSMNGRIGLVSLAGGDVSILTLGLDWKDAQPAWLPDGRRLVVSARARPGEPAGLHLLEPAADGSIGRRVLTQPRTGDDESPAASPDGRFVVFAREEHLLRVELGDGRVRRLTGGFKRERSPRFLPDGRIVCAWSDGKRHGIDAIDAEGTRRAPLAESGAFYRTISPTPDGRFLAATLSWDAGFHPLDALLGGDKERVVLLDAKGAPVASLEASRRHASHSPAWGR
jgi:Tol biopolymer transport system component